jgi:hypothetical protein
MRNAPSVVYPVGRCALYGRVLLVLGCASLLIWMGWGVSASMFDQWLFWLGGSVWLLWALCSGRAWAGTPEGLLQWDSLADPGAGPQRGGAWIWSSASGSGGSVLRVVASVIDWQSGMLLRLAGPGGATQWAWVERSRAPERWDDLRRALLASGPR